MNYKEFLDRDGLESFNHILNERYQGRFKYMGEFELNNDFTDFNVLVPAHVGDVYQAKTGEVDEITFGEMTIKDGDWFVVLNESRFDADDPTIIKTHANDPEADWAVGNVEIAKLGSQMDNLVAYGYYDAIKPIAPYAYEAHYDGLNYPYAYENFDDVVAATGGCSAVRVGNEFGRNLDWIYNEQVDFVVHTSAKGGRYATLGLCGQISKLDKDFVASKEYATEYVLLPFYCVDGINEKHVFVSMNVMPDDPTTPNEIEPDGEIYASICANMIPRYILDHCATADEAIEYIQHHLKIHFSEKAREGGFLPHYLIGDTDKTYVVEYVGGNVVATLANNNSAVMTNFRIAGTTPNADGKYNTPEDKASGLPSVVNGLDAHAAGVERFNLAKTEIGMGTSTSLLMEKLHYTNTYKSASPFWYSEYVGMNGTTIDSDTGDFASAVAAAVAVYNARSRDPEDANYGTWQSKHTCVYDIDTLKLSASFQEEAGTYEFEIAEEDALPDGINDGDALIYVGGKWQIMPQYGYIEDSENSYDEDITMFIDADGLYRTNLADELVFIEGESYTVKVGDIAEETAIAVRAGDLADPDDSIDPNEIIFKGEHITIAKRLGGVSTVLTMDNGTLDPVHLSLVGKLQGDYHTIDPRYIEKIIEEVDELPIDDIEENKIYKTHTPWNIDSVYILSDAAVEAGWTADAYGIHSTDLELDWDTVNEDWENQQTLFTAYAAGNIYRFRLSGGEEYSIMFKAEDAVEPPKHDDRISLWVFDNESNSYKEIRSYT